MAAPLGNVKHLVHHNDPRFRRGRHGDEERTLQKIAPPTTRSRRFRATDRLLTFLDRL